MVRKLLSSLLILSALLCFPVYGAQQIRPNAGIGLLIIRPFSPDRASENSSMTLYNYPGVKRIAEVKNDVIPELHPVLDSAPGAYAVGVTGKKGNWLKIAYDDAGREGWVKMSDVGYTLHGKAFSRDVLPLFYQNFANHLTRFEKIIRKARNRLLPYHHFRNCRSSRLKVTGQG